MSKKAKEAALKAYPNVEQPAWNESYPKTLFVRHTERNAFIQGYEQAEKDLALTWEDIKTIFRLADNYESELNRPKYLTQEYCEEVLRRFNEQRNRQ